jgi:hypothetical protein
MRAPPPRKDRTAPRGPQPRHNTRRPFWALMRRPGAAESLVAAGIFAASDLWFALTQPLIEVAGGRGWDGVSYYTVAAQLVAGQHPVGEAPFVYRLGTPFLASVIAPQDLIAGFAVVNAAANALGAMLFFHWLRLFIGDPRVRIAMFVSFIFMWHGPIRFAPFYPVAAEHVAFAVTMLGVFGVRLASRRLSPTLIGGLIALAFAGAIARETTILVPAALPLARNALRRDGRIWLPAPALFVPIAAGVAGLAVAHSLATQTNAYGFVSAALNWFSVKNPLVYVLGWLDAFGPLLIVPLLGWRRTVAFLGSNQPLAGFLAICAVLGWIGGQDTERYVFWAAPVVYVAIGISLVEVFDRLSASVAAIVVGAQALAERVFFAIPQPSTLDPELLPRDRSFVDFMLFTPVGSNVDYFDLWSFWMPRVAKLMLVGEYALLFLGVAAVFYWRSARSRTLPSEIGSATA